MFSKLLGIKTIKIKISDSKLVKHTPKTYSEARLIAKEILNGNVIVLDLGELSKTDAIRMVDLLAGVLLTIEGEYKKIANMTFLMAPTKELLTKYYATITSEIHNEKDNIIK